MSQAQAVQGQLGQQSLPPAVQEQAGDGNPQVQGEGQQQQPDPQLQPQPQQQQQQQPGEQAQGGEQMHMVSAQELAAMVQQQIAAVMATDNGQRPAKRSKPGEGAWASRIAMVEDLIAKHKSNYTGGLMPFTLGIGMSMDVPRMGSAAVTFVLTLVWMAANVQYAHVSGDAAAALMEASAKLATWVAFCVEHKMPKADFEGRLHQVLSAIMGMAHGVEVDHVAYQLHIVTSMCDVRGLVLEQLQQKAVRGIPPKSRGFGGKICMYYNQKGGCKKGAACNMRHVCKTCPDGQRHSAASEECPANKTAAKTGESSA